MCWTKARFAALALVPVLACGKSDAKRLEEMRACSAITIDAQGAANCLVLQYNWKKDQALSYAQRFEQEQDSMAQHAADSVWHVDAARHVKEIKQCAGDPSGDVARCLLGYGWAEERARATEDSLWRTHAHTHRREIQACSRRRDMQPGACLQLYYKWSPARALAVDDSIRRAKLR